MKKELRFAIGVICTTILAAGVVLLFVYNENARVGMSFAFGITLLIFGMLWGLENKK